MFYEPSKQDHQLQHDPFKAIVAPRPIGWITSMSAKGDINLAPYSYFNAVLTSPAIVMFSSDGRKDTIAFVEETREFVCNLATWDLRTQMNATSASYPRGINEMREAGLDPAPSVLVRPPRVKASPCALECRWLQTVRLRDIDGAEVDAHVAFGQVIGVHIDDRFIKDGLVDTAAMRPIARGGYHDYFVATSDTRFSLRRPKAGAAADLDAIVIVGEQASQDQAQ
jgi:flavin reductase (DIM6/NTAB) family NADH-FMN oxidoreductase RutF